MNWFQDAIKKLRKSGGLGSQSFIIASAEDLRDENPRSFSIPRLEQRKSLKVGDSAKIILCAKYPEGPINSERLWVEIECVDENSYQARIDNSPVIFPEIEDQIINILPEHIVSIILPENYILPYGKTCKVSKAVLNRSEWPYRLSRISPDDIGDSGWRVYSESEIICNATESVACDMLMSKYQVLDSVMDEPNLENWSWCDSENEYRRIA